MVKESARGSILDAAERVVRERGASHVTLDAVAEAAGLSKGGVLYHFQTKEAMLVALVQRLVDTFRSVYSDAQARMGDDPARSLEAFVEAVFGMDESLGHASCALLPALATNPELLEPLRSFYRNHFSQLNNTPVGWDQAAVVTLALDGMWLLEMLGISPLTDKDERRIQKLLTHMATAPIARC